MKVTLATIFAGLLLAAPAMAQDPMAEGTRSFHTDLLMNPDTGPGDDVGFGLKLAAGLSLYDFDDMAVFVGHLDADRNDRTTVGLSIEESYDLDLPVTPYIALAMGYAWTDQRNNEDAESMYWTAEFGLRYFIRENLGLSLYAEQAWSMEEVFSSTDGLDDKTLEFGLGLSYYY